MVDVIADCEANGTAAEKALIKACREGRQCKLNYGKLPEAGATHAPTIRATLIRALALEKTSLHEKGLWLEGAVVTGQLDLSFGKCRGRLVLHNCHFADEPQMAQAELAQLSLDGSHLPGLFAQDVLVTGGLFLRGVTATGTVAVNSAEIGGQLSCIGATLNGGAGKALNAQGAKVTGSVFLRAVTATGTVDVNSAQIGGQLSCIGATLNGGAGDALTGQSLRVADGFLFRRIKAVTGRVNLASAHVGDLVDDGASWDMCEDVILDGFTYDRIGGGTSPKSFAARKNWLANGSRVGAEFRPQPYTQFARVMRAVGHLGEARKALMERDRLQAIEARLGDYKRPQDGRYLFPLENPWADVKFVARWSWDSLLRLVAGYGYAPVRSLVGLSGLFVAAWAIAYLAWEEGSFAPNSDVILVSKGWTDLLNRDCLPPIIGVCDHNPAQSWSNDPQNGLDWDSFSAVGYAADLVIPILDLGQESAWAPSKDRGFWGFHLWWGRWALAALGWIVTALGAAAVTGIIQRNSPD